MKKVIITGANGFVGQHLAPLVLKSFKKSEILCLVWGNSDLEKRGRKILKECGLECLDVDLVTKKGLSKIPKSPKIIFHLAANTDTSKSDHRINDIGTKNLLEAIGPLGPSNHFIYTGTTVLMSGRIDCRKPFDEEDPAAPSNEYGRSKLRAESVLKEACIRDKFRLTILRLNTVYGDDPREYKLFKSMKIYIEKGSIISRINWPGLTSIIHVDDVVSALLNFSKILPVPGSAETYLLYAEALSMSQISHLMHKTIGKEYKVIKLPDLFWQICSFGRRFVPSLEIILPQGFYNLFWRSCLIVDDVVVCKSNKAARVLKNWKPRKFKDSVEDVLV